MKNVKCFAVCIMMIFSTLIGAQQVSAGFLSGLQSIASKTTGLVKNSGSKQQEVPTAESHSILNHKEFYAGYSEDFQEFKSDIEDGKVVEAYESREKHIAKKQKDPNVLFAWEQALMALDANKRNEAIKYLDVSEKLLEQRASKTVTEDAGKTLLTEGIKFVGFDEFGEYEGEPFERILMLNYKSIAYMLNGDRKAYNVTRRAIDWQNIEKKAFDKRMAQVNKDLKKEQKQQDKQNDSTSSESKNIFEPIAAIFKNSESKALQVPSAFVNPFGFYMSGIVQEYDSYDDPSLRDNARISYQKALELNPNSKVIKQALQAVKKKAPHGQRLIQIVVADGFAPEKKVSSFELPFSGSTIPIKLPIYIQDESHVSKIEVQDCKGKCLATLSQVADLDAITMRHQYDSLPEQRLRLILTVGRSIAENKVAQSAGFLGMMAKTIRDDNTNPDMRSWMGLPKQILATRLLLPKGVNNLSLVSFNSNGKVLVRKKLKLRKNDHSFIYARSFDKVLYVNQGEKLWVTMR